MDRTESFLTSADLMGDRPGSARDPRVVPESTDSNRRSAPTRFEIAPLLTARKNEHRQDRCIRLYAPLLNDRFRRPYAIGALILFFAVGRTIAESDSTAARRFTRPCAARAGAGGQSGALPTRFRAGRLLFWDPILSGHNDAPAPPATIPNSATPRIATLSIWRQRRRARRPPALAPRNAIPLVKRNSQTILNVAFNGIDEAELTIRRTHRCSGISGRASLEAAGARTDSRRSRRCRAQRVRRRPAGRVRSPRGSTPTPESRGSFRGRRSPRARSRATSSPRRLPPSTTVDRDERRRSSATGRGDLAAN